MKRRDVLAPLDEEAWLSTLARVLVHAITGAVLAFPLTTTEGIAAAAAGAALGSWSARYLAKSRLRTVVVVLLGAVGLVVTTLAHWLVVGPLFMPEALGPAGALAAGEGVTFGLGGLVVSATLRTLSARQRAWALLEVGAIAGAFATILIAHRHGAIHRPYVIADPLLARGEDPTLAILAIGAVGAATIGLLLLSERSLLRSALHLGVVVALLLVVLATTTMVGLPPPPPGSGGALGLRDDPDRSRRGGAGGSGQRNRQDELEFRDSYDRGGGEAPVAVVLLHDDYSPPTSVYYFRQGAFSQYNERRLVAATLSGVDEDVHNVFPAGDPVEVPWSPSAGLDRSTVESTVALLADHPRPFALEAPIQFAPAPNPNLQRFRRVYRVRSAVLTSDEVSLLGRAAGDPSWDDATRAHYTQGPPDPRYRALAERIVAALPEGYRDDPVARAVAITSHLGHHGTYSLRSRHAGAEDPTAHFLFGDLTGYCVHFAHAAVYLMRSIGLPARVATGYAVSESTRQGGSAILVRDADSHAWPEVFISDAMPASIMIHAAHELVRPDRIAVRFDPATLASRGVSAAALARALGADAAAIERGEPVSVPPIGDLGARLVNGISFRDLWAAPPAPVERIASLRMTVDGRPVTITLRSSDVQFGSGAEGEDVRAVFERALGSRAVVISEGDELMVQSEVLGPASSITIDSAEPEGALDAFGVMAGQSAHGSESGGWIVMDVSPETVLDPPPPPPDPQLQRLLGEMARGQSVMPLEGPQPRPIAEMLRRAARPAGLAIAAILFAIVMLGYTVKLWRRGMPLVSSAPRVLYRASLDRLAEAGLRRRWGESREAFASRCRAQLPSLAPLTGLHLAAAFGGRAGGAGAKMRELSRALSRERRAAVPFWRRLLGLLNPFSFLWTR